MLLLVARSRRTSQKARQQAEAHTNAEKQEIAEQAKNKIDAAERAQESARVRIANRQKQATAAPKQQLADAGSKMQDARRKRDEAARLNALATKERQQRQASN